MKKRPKTPAERAHTDKIRNERIAIAGGKCEWTGKRVPTQMHHICDADWYGRLKSERWIESVRMLGEEAHTGQLKHECIPALRREFDLFLRGKGYTDEVIREITGRKLYI
jgi:hypothetical protein